MCVFPAILVIPIELPQIVNKGLHFKHSSSSR